MSNQAFLAIVSRQGKLRSWLGVAIFATAKAINIDQRGLLPPTVGGSGAKWDLLPSLMPDEAPGYPPFSGIYRHTMDAKHRVTIPSRWRHGEQDQFYLMPSPTNNHLYALPPTEFQKVNEKLNNDPRISASDRRQFARYYFSRALHCLIDRQGRLLLPDEFCRLAGLESDVLLIGTFDRFEVWSPERWERASTDEADTFQHVASLIGA